MCEAAVRLARAARYRNAGTVEFVLARWDFYFLEMNTRLQVEHPVTEYVPGWTLWPSSCASPQAAPCRSRRRVHLRGHAMECRICAEEPEHDFRPATGRVGVLEAPQAARALRRGHPPGQAITPAFDSMLAKLVPSATPAWRPPGLERALGELVLLGVPTNIDYLRRIVRHPEFLAGRLHTGFLGEHAAGLASRSPTPGVAAAARLRPF